jgi:cell division protein WhiA
VSGTERDLVLALRAELAGIDPARECDREAERAGLDLGDRWRDATLARLAVRLARHSSEGASSLAGFDWADRPENGRTHLELVLPVEEAPLVQGWLAEAEVPAGWRLRRGRGVVTLKSAEHVQQLLRRMGAGASLLEIETRQVARTLRGDLNRVINAESANLARTVRAAGRQLEAIAALSADGRLTGESTTVRAVAAARRETPEATLGELADRLAMHRSAVQRALDRIERLALA